MSSYRLSLQWKELTAGLAVAAVIKLVKTTQRTKSMWRVNIADMFEVVSGINTKRFSVFCIMANSFIPPSCALIHEALSLD